uniref:Uncharacterized protein n=1 Tax=Paramoeba aestuarina TaxID=180227 RepID=A0A7S4KRE6_9EUKA
MSHEWAVWERENKRKVKKMKKSPEEEAEEEKKLTEKEKEERKAKEEIFKNLFTTNGVNGDSLQWSLRGKDLPVALSDKNYRAWAPFEFTKPSWVRSHRAIVHDEIVRWTLQVGKEDGGKQYRFGVVNEKGKRFTFDSEKVDKEKREERDNFFDFELDRTCEVPVLRFWQNNQKEQVIEITDLKEKDELYPTCCLLCHKQSYTILNFEEGNIGGDIKG